MNKKIAYVIATYFGLGMSKYAPGTCGSLGTLPLAYVLINYGGFWALIAAAVIIFALGCRATKVVVEDSHISDPGKVVIDETVGQLLAFSIIAAVESEYLHGIDSWFCYVLGFAYFRFFDILKMGPVKYADTKINNEYGVMLDDVFAGIFAAILLTATLFGFSKLYI